MLLKNILFKSCTIPVVTSLWFIFQLVVNLTSPEYGEYIRTRINDNTTENYTYYEPDFDMFVDGGTAHMSVLAPDGAAVAVTMTINLL